MPYSTQVKNGKKILIPDLAADRWNWPTYHEKLFQAAEAQNSLRILDGTTMKPTNKPWNPLGRAAWIHDNTEVQYLIVMMTPPIIHNHLTLEMTAHELFKTLRGLFEKEPNTTTTVYDVWHNHTTQVAAHTSRTPDDCTPTQCTPATESDTGRENKGRAH
jgi:hypothetical protein